MKIVVVGGRLQGIEATYLAHQAGWEVILLDMDRMAPAVGLCDEFYQLEISNNPDELAKMLSKADLIIPAVEDPVVLQCLEETAMRKEIPLAFDASSYAISSSKIKSDNLFAGNAIPAPRYWPKCDLPIIAKPSNTSGSQGVQKIFTYEDLSGFLKQRATDLNNWIIQEFLEGPAYSLEIMGMQGNLLTLQTTDLEMDSGYDCKRVLAPTKLAKPGEKQFKEIACKIARLINLNGIMDIEVVEQNGVLKVLEIDARLPSQTPTVVYKSTGINMVTQLYDVFCLGRMPELPKIIKEKAVIYEHIHVSADRIEILGEHVMAQAGPLKFQQNFFEADEALTNFRPGAASWAATLILTGENREEVGEKRSRVIENIKRHLKLTTYVDSTPGTNIA